MKNKPSKGGSEFTEVIHKAVKEAQRGQVGPNRVWLRLLNIEISAKSE